MAGTAWERGRFDRRTGSSQLLFGRMYEDATVELRAFPPGGRVFCIASAGCTAMRLAPHHEVVAADINPVQLAYARSRFAGAPAADGRAERVLGFGRALAPIVGFGPSRLGPFLDLDDPVEQLAYWRRHLDTPRFRAALRTLFSVTALRAVYAPPLLASLPPRFGAVLRGRLERGFGRHSNRNNPYARSLLLGEPLREPPPAAARGIRAVEADAAAFLESQPAGSFAAFALSNILDGASAAYARRLFAAVKHAAAPGAMVVTRSFGEPGTALATNRAADDRAMLWGIVDVRAVAER